MIKILSPASVHMESAYQLFCSCREQPWSQSLFQQSLRKPYSLIAFADRIVVGVAVVSQVLDEAELEDICVHVDYRKRGIARDLLKGCILRLREDHIGRCNLEVRQSNQAAIKLYESLGFIKLGERKAYYPLANGGSETALLYRLNII